MLGELTGNAHMALPLAVTIVVDIVVVLLAAEEVFARFSKIST